ncbi:MAG: HdeD family acid-resistance protein [Sphingomonas pseudosanguinis]|uniref:HdeD family acid-resistance protein n=1 Tax=Sphingomonas pseudosanguinis TaxID=413712 RepID=UPI00391A31FF
MTDTDRSFATALRPGAGWGWILAYGVLSALLGLAAFVFPVPATLAATLVVGAFLIASGLVSMGAGIFGKGHEGRGYAIGFGLVTLIIGLIMAFEPATGAISITILVAVWLGLRGALEIGLGAKMRRRRGWMIAMGVLNIILALFVLATLPWSAMTLPGYIVGISFLFGGITAIASALDHKKGASAFSM